MNEENKDTPPSLANWMHQVEADKLGEAFELLMDQVVILDRNAIIRFANSAMIVKTGYTKSEFIGKNPHDVWGGHMSKDFYGVLWYTVKQEKKHFVGQNTNQRRDGSEYIEELHVSPVLDDKGEAKYFIGIAFDITDRKPSKENAVD